LTSVDSPTQHTACVRRSEGMVIVCLRGHFTATWVCCTAAAVSFVIQPDGIFVDFMAVSHSHHSGSCELTKDYFQPATQSQRALLRSVEGGSFRGQGLETFLIALPFRFAVLKCMERVAICLKCTKGQRLFCAGHGFKVAPKEHIRSPNLFAFVPKSDVAAKPPDAFLICMAQTAPKVTVPNLSEAASVLAHLKDPPPSPPEAADSDTKRPPGDTHPPDDVAKRSSRKLRAQQQAFDRVAVVHSASEDSDSESSNANVTVTHSTSHAWTLPTRDHWEPQSREHQKFKGCVPGASHQLNQQELNQKCRLQANQPWRRLQVIQKAFQFFWDTEFMKKQEASRSSSNNKHKRQRYDAEFTPQMHLDFAALTNSNRDVQVKSKSVKGNDLVSVAVSSYKLPTDIKLATDMKLAALVEDPVAKKTVIVSKTWLVETCRPDVADWLAESLEGTKVHRIGGGNVGADAFSLECSGKSEQDHAFVSVPQGHVANKFTPIGPPLLSKKLKPKSEKAKLEGNPEPYDQNFYSDACGKATESLRWALRKEAEQNGALHAALPPAADTQMVKLEWVPTSRSNKNKEECGMWHGTFAVRLGVYKGSTVLQECGLLSTWVEEAFAEPLRRECRAMAFGRVGKRDPKHFLFIRAGDIHDTNLDPPPSSELLLDVHLVCLQGDEDSCLRHSMASLPRKPRLWRRRRRC
jgi:hypothetical protein